MDTEFHTLNWQFCSKTPNDIYKTFLSGTYKVNGKEITFKNAQLICVTEKDGETIFSVIVSELDLNALDIHGRNFSGSITERHYEYAGDDPHSCGILYHKGGKTMLWNPETQRLDEYPGLPRQTREENEKDWARQMSYEAEQRRYGR